MLDLRRRLRFTRDRSAAGGVETVLMVALIAGASLLAAARLGEMVEARFGSVADIVAQAPESEEPEQAIPALVPLAGTATGWPGEHFAIVIADAGLLTGTLGQSFSFNMANLAALADPGPLGVENLLWSLVSGSLPIGLVLDPHSGQITGIPQAVGSYSFTISALFADHSSSMSMTIVVLDQQSEAATSGDVISDW